MENQYKCVNTTSNMDNWNILNSLKHNYRCKYLNVHIGSEIYVFDKHAKKYAGMILYISLSFN